MAEEEPSFTPIFKRKKAKGRDSAASLRSFGGLGGGGGGGSAPSTPAALGGEDEEDEGNVAIVRSKKKSATGKVKEREKGRSRLSFGADVRALVASLTQWPSG